MEFLSIMHTNEKFAVGMGQFADLKGSMNILGDEPMVHSTQFQLQYTPKERTIRKISSWIPLKKGPTALSFLLTP